MSKGGHTVPFVAVWPAMIPAGQICRETVMTMDFLPTFAKLAGATPPVGHVMDGMNVLPMLKGEAKATESTMHWRFGEEWAVRQGAWKLTGKGTNTLTLVNLQSDIEEKKSQINEKPELVSELIKLHQQWIEEVGYK